jgi:nucleotide-binding universal stress UspA family protein
MTTILCPTRGGEASYPNQDGAIALAKKRQARLIFMYVYNIQFPHIGVAPFLDDLEKEMDELGEFLLTMAQERAEEKGVTAEAVVRHGDFREALMDVVQEFSVDTVTMGAAAGPEGYTDEEFFKRLADFLHENANVEVCILRGGDLIAEYPARSSESN